jgi:hypothetical protein
MHRNRMIVALGAVAAAVTLTAGCGGSDDAGAGDVASLDAAASATEAAADRATAATTSDDEALLEWAQCMRDNGVDVADPTVDADGNPQFAPPGGDSGIDPQSEEFQAAGEACNSLLEGTTFGGGAQLDGVQDLFVEFADCLRDQGLDVGDPDLGDGPPAGGDAGGPGAGPGDPGDGLTAELLEGIVPGLDAGDPATQPAVDACESILVDGLDAAGIGA